MRFVYIRARSLKSRIVYDVELLPIRRCCMQLAPGLFYLKSRAEQLLVTVRKIIPDRAVYHLFSRSLCFQQKLTSHSLAQARSPEFPTALAALTAHYPGWPFIIHSSALAADSLPRARDS